MPTFSRNTSAAAMASALDWPSTRRGASMMLSRMVMCGHRLKLWKTKPTRARSRLIWALSAAISAPRSEEHTSELQSRPHLVCRLLLEKKKINYLVHQLNYAIYDGLDFCELVLIPRDEVQVLRYWC